MCVWASSHLSSGFILWLVFFVVENFFLLGRANFEFLNSEVTSLMYLWPGLYPSVVVPLVRSAEV